MLNMDTALCLLLMSNGLSLLTLGIGVMTYELELSRDFSIETGIFQLLDVYSSDGVVA